jgi:fructose 1,6-bisphosphatase
MPSTASGGVFMSAAMEKISEQLAEYKNSGLIADYELVEVDDSIRVRIVAPANQDAASVKSFVVDALAGLLSESQVSIDAAGA